MSDEPRCINRDTGKPCDWRDPNAVLVEDFDAEYRALRRRSAMTALAVNLQMREHRKRVAESDPRRAVDPMGMTARDEADRAIDEFHRRDASQLAKEDVNYSYATDPARSCGTCANFDGKSGCLIVAGLIRRVDTCSRWSQA